jgi:LysM repeat protein
MSVYAIKPGDTLSQIALRNRTTVEQLARANGIQNPDLIHAGKTLRIPAAQPGGQDAFIDPQKPRGTGMPQLNPPPSGTTQGAQQAIDVGRSLIGRAYGDPAGASAQPVGRNSSYMHCAQFVNAVYPDLPASAPQLHQMSTKGAEPRPGDVVTSSQPAPWGHVGIMTERGTILHSIPGRGVHESSRAEFEQYSPITGVVQR